MQYRVYNTGDQLWTSVRNGTVVTVKVITHDGIVWEEGDASPHKLTGAELYVHKATVFCMKWIAKLAT